MLLNSTVRNGPANKSDVAVDIKELPTGKIIVLANTQSSNNFSDFWILNYSPTLSILNTKIYDYAGQNDIALGIDKISTTQIVVIGTSASSSVSAAYVQVVYNQSNLSFVSEKRSNISGTALDQALAYCRDASNNTYITGRAWNGTNFDIKTIKITSTFLIAWTSTLNPYGKDDAANCITLDPLTGNVIIGGYATKTNNYKEIICARLSNLNGALIGGLYNQSSENFTGDAYLKQVFTKPNGDVYFVGGEKGNSGYNQVIVGKIKANGTPSWQRIITNSTNDFLPSDIIMQSNGDIFVISVNNPNNPSSYIVTSYSELELDTSKTNYGNATYKKNELIVRFLGSALNPTVINNQVGTAVKEFGDLRDFMTPTAYATVTTAIQSKCKPCILKATKIFTEMLTTNTLSTSRLGEPIQIPDFWAALNIVLPANFAVSDAHKLFNKMPSVVAYAHPNLIAKLHNYSNDSLYNQQLSLHSSTLYPNSDVNLEEAYRVIPNGGQPFIRCTVIDERLDWQHRDFGYDGVNPSSSKIAGGFIWGTWQPLKSVGHGGCNGIDHGTAVTGIIGANRNNVKGIVGIAGGNDSTGSKGISLYNTGVYLGIGYGYGPLSVLTPIITYAAQSPTIPLGLPTMQHACNQAHIINNSWGFYTPPIDTGWYATVNQNNTIVQEAVHFVNRLKVTVVASRGNGGGSYGSLSTPAYPANCDDDWVLCVGGTGIDGKFMHSGGAVFPGTNGELTASYGGDIDVAAPATASLVTTLGSLGGLVGMGNTSPSITNNYISIYGTSASAPHVSGAVGLIMSYLYDSTNKYATYPTPEDCEHILQLSATDIDSSGWDRYSGYGRLNIGKAMRLIEKPTHKLWHFNTKSPFSYSVTKTLVSAVDTIKTTEQWSRKNSNGTYTSFQKGKYIVKTYRINSTVFHNIPTTDTIISYWSRPSSCATFPLFTGSGSNKKLMPREKTIIQSFNNSNCALRGYIYQVKDSTGTSVGWWPVDTAFVNTNYGEWAEYSVLTKNATALGVKEYSDFDNNISLYPNPTNSNLTLEIKTTKVSTLTIELYDIMGRKLKTVYSGKSEPVKTYINDDVANLPNSLYFYFITIDEGKTTKKFVKQ